jgi:hypothetical protein
LYNIRDRDGEVRDEKSRPRRSREPGAGPAFRTFALPAAPERLAVIPGTAGREPAWDTRASSRLSSRQTGVIVFKSIAARLVGGLLLTALSVKASVRLTDLIATKAFAATDTLYLQWSVAIVVGALGLLSAFFWVKELSHPQPRPR